VRGFVRLFDKAKILSPEAVFPAGTRKLFDQSEPPTGWTRDTSASLNDRLIRIVVGTRTPEGGSWTISGLSAGGHSHSYSDVVEHTHPVSVAAHSHPQLYFTDIDTDLCSPKSPGQAYSFGTDTEATTVSVSSTGVAAPANSLSTTPSISADGTWRPLYRDAIIAEKD